MDGWIRLGVYAFIVLVVLVVIAVYEPSEPLCQYCNNDGDPCPRCGGYNKKERN